MNARIYAAKIPTVEVPEALARHRFNRLELALHGGEDYQLLFTVPSVYERRVPKLFRGTQITKIGEILKAKSGRASGFIELVDAAGKKTALTSQGWDSFRATPHK